MEDHVRQVAARLGVADFVMIPQIVSKGSAFREIGDGLLCCGEQGAVLQVKSREPAAACADDRDRSESWVRKNVKKAIDQGRGTKRALTDARRLSPIELCPVRALDAPAGRRQEFIRPVSADVSAWPIIVVVEHPGAPEMDLGLDDDVFAITTRDWEFLNTAIRSVAGLLDYVDRCMRYRPVFSVPLGRETDRFDEICRADAATDDGSSTWAPWLSRAALEDLRAANIYQHLIDRAWPAGEPLPGVPPGEYLQITEFLDRVPPTARVEIGGRMRSYVESTVVEGQRSGFFMLPDKAIVMVVSHTTAPVADGVFPATVTALGAVRVQEVGQLFGPRPLLAIGVLSQPGSTDYFFARLDGPQALGPVPDDVVDSVYEEFGRLVDNPHAAVLYEE